MKRTQQILFGILLILGLGFTACDEFDDLRTRGEGPLVTEEVILSRFDGVSLNIDADVYIHQSEDQRVEVTMQENLFDVFKTNVNNNGTWRIDFEGIVTKSEPIEINIYVPSLDELRIAGSGDIVTVDTFTADQLELKISGSGDMNLLFFADDVDLKISGSGDVVMFLETRILNSDISGSGKLDLRGSTELFESRIAGSGDVHAFDFICRTANLQTTGSGTHEVTVTEDLDVHISGSGDVIYKGEPRINFSGSGSGTVTHLR